MEMRKRVLGEGNPRTLTSISNLATTYWDQGRWKEAEDLKVQVMEMRKRVLGEEHPDTLVSMSNLAFTWKKCDKYVQALRLMGECMLLQARVLGADHPHTISSFEALFEGQMENLETDDSAVEGAADTETIGGSQVS